MERNAGISLIELAIGLSVLLVGILAFFSNFYVNIRASAMVAGRDQARAAFDDLGETIRNDLFEDAYTRYHGMTVTVPELEGPAGGFAEVEVRCHVNETTLPAEFGPLLDIDGDGALATVDCSAGYELLPVELRIQFLENNEVIILSSHMVLGGDD